MSAVFAHQLDLETRCACQVFRADREGFYRRGAWWCSEPCYERINDPEYVAKAIEGNRCYGK